MDGDVDENRYFPSFDMPETDGSDRRGGDSKSCGVLVVTLSKQDMCPRYRSKKQNFFQGVKSDGFHPRPFLPSSSTAGLCRLIVAKYRPMPLVLMDFSN